MVPTNKFYEVTICFTTTNEKNGREKKVREKYLVDAVDTTMVEKNVFELMKDTSLDWEITSIHLSPIREVFIMGRAN